MRRQKGSTLVEVLVVVGVLALLLAILLPAMSSAKSAANDLRCRTQLRTVAVKFQDFASESGVALRGESTKLGDRLFLLEDFQESVYQIDEYWNGGATGRSFYDSGAQPMMCPSASHVLERRANMPCSVGAVGPSRNVSTGFNKRLESRSKFVNGIAVRAPAILNDKILNTPDVPLVFDVDGDVATQKNQMPYYSAPPLPVERPNDIYSTGQFWYPSFRHRGSIDVAFFGGHVLGSRLPLSEPWWRWGFQPD